MAHLYRLVLVALLLVLSGQAHAQLFKYRSVSAGNTGIWYGTPVEVCQGVILPAWGLPGPGTTFNQYSQVWGCQDNNGGYRGEIQGQNVNITCTAPQTAQFTGGGTAGGTWSCSNPTCPTNESYTSGACNCNSGFQRINGTCVSDAEALCAGLTGTETYASTPGNVAPGASSCNPTGCTATFAGTVIRVKNAAGQYVTEGAVTFTGGTCVYSESTGVTEDTCPGGSSGTINGIATCVPYDPNLNTIESVKDSTNTTGDGTNETVTGKTTTTVCNAVGACTTTTVTQTSVNGGAPTTTTETTKENRDDFCTKNPKDPQCSNSAFAGSCSGGFTCTGDAIQCAVAKQTHELNCALNKDSPQKTLFEQERSSTPGLADIDGRTETISAASFASNNSLGASACIPNLAVTVMGQTIALPFSDICDELAYLRLVLLACSWFIAYRTVAGSVREG